MKTIKIGLDGLSALDKVAKALFIETKMTNNINFPGAALLLALLLAARVKLENAIAAALDGGKAATFAKNEAEAELDEAITQMAGHVMSVAGHNEAIILSAGFEVRKPPMAIGQLPAPSNMRADLTDMPGQILVDWDPVHGAHEFELERNSVDPSKEDEWKLRTTLTKSRFLDEGLASSSIHWYRVRARGTAGDGPYSDPARGMAR